MEMNPLHQRHVLIRASIAHPSCDSSVPFLRTPQSVYYSDIHILKKVHQFHECQLARSDSRHVYTYTMLFHRQIELAVS